MEAPEVIFPTRAQDAPIEHYDGTTYANSGILDATPDDPAVTTPNTSFSLTFDKPGLYSYLCQIHPLYMSGVVAVEPATSEDMPTQAEIDTQIASAQEQLTGIVAGMIEAGQTPRSDTLADGSHVWYVDAGANLVGDGTTNVYAFLAQELTINAGDTVVWASHDFHTITFAPVPPDPFYVEFRPQADGTSLRVLNPAVLAASKPSQVYDPTQYYNSGFIGPAMPDGSTWSLTFAEPGTYPYRCAVHGEFGMKGTIIVK